MTPAIPTQFVRLRQVEDLRFVGPATADIAVVNANLLENNHQAVQDWLSRTGMPFIVDPALWRFQDQSWPSRPDGSLKRNYARLSIDYERGTSIEMGGSALSTVGITTRDWATLAANTVRYQGTRPRQDLSRQLSLIDDDAAADPLPAGIVAPYLVNHDSRDLEINRLLHQAAAEEHGGPVWKWIAIDEQRFRQTRHDDLLDGIATDNTAGVILWLTGVPDDRLVVQAELLSRVQRLAQEVSGRGVPFILNGGYVALALSGAGVSGILHPIRWVDNGEPAKESAGGRRSCQVYVLGLHAAVRFNDARDLARELNEETYLRLFCNCFICAGAFNSGHHPLDLLLEAQPIRGPRGGTRLTPTSRALLIHSWHFLSARRAEVSSFVGRSAAAVVTADFERAVALAGSAPHLQILATRVGAA